jgi:hypothetical protein
MDRLVREDRRQALPQPGHQLVPPLLGCAFCGRVVSLCLVPWFHRDLLGAL